MEYANEKDLVRKAKKNPEAFGIIFDRYYDSIFGYILKRTGNIQTSQDITSETFFKALDKLYQFRWKNISISSWLYRIATNEMNQYFRRQKKSPYSLNYLLEEKGFEFQSEINLIEEIIEQEKELAKAAEWKKVRKQIEKFPEKYQEVLTLRFFESKKISEISEILGKKEGTIKSLLSRAINKLGKTQPK